MNKAEFIAELANNSGLSKKNPRTGEVMKIEATKAPKFKAGKSLKDAINA